MHHHSHFSAPLAGAKLSGAQLSGAPSNKPGDVYWAHRNELRSTVTMMRYLARTSAQPAFRNGPLQQVVTVADRRRGKSDLTQRTNQERMEAQLQTRVQTMAAVLEANAHQKAHAKAVAAAASKQANWQAEHAARVMGAVAPHRRAAKGAALAVVAPSETLVFPDGGSPPGSPTILRTHPKSLPAECEPSLAPFMSPTDGEGGEGGYAPFHPRSPSYLLRSCCHTGHSCHAAPLPQAEYLSYSINRPRPEKLQRQLCTFSVASGAPWTLRHQYRSGACCLVTEGGARLYASASGELALSDHPGAELAHFLILPLPQGEVETAIALGLSLGGGALAAAAPSSGGDVAAARPQTACAPRESPRHAPEQSSQLVRIFHKPSGSFLSVDRQSSRVSLKDVHQVKSIVESVARGREDHWDVIFELQPHHPAPPHAQHSARRSNSARPKVRHASAPLPKPGGLPLRSADVSRPPSATLPVLGFNMSTGKAETLACVDVAAEESAPRPLRTTLNPVQPAPAAAPRLASDGSVLSPSTRKNKVWEAEVGERARAIEAASAWDSKQLDLKSVLSKGPLLMSDFFNLSAPAPPAQREEPDARNAEFVPRWNQSPPAVNCARSTLAEKAARLPYSASTAGITCIEHQGGATYLSRPTSRGNQAGRVERNPTTTSFGAEPPLPTVTPAEMFRCAAPPKSTRRRSPPCSPVISPSRTAQSEPFYPGILPESLAPSRTSSRG
ncbi:hypothetical protein AB1Y20_002312 [Prymnesium parvum]|uniref:Uncharacterized protein n=1 Tax=Prymnesium parvum TaxID=97485 RepID=A0AB34JA26_PRYPA